MYLALDVWDRMDDAHAVRFRCFQNLRTGKFSVQSSDFYSLPIDKSRADILEYQHAELFIQSPPEERGGGFDTLGAAIKDHMEKFGKS